MNDQDFLNLFHIMSREEYLAERKRWKKIYLKLSADIKALKKATREAAKGGWEAYDRLQSLRMRTSNEATAMMEELEDLKAYSRISVILLRHQELSNSSP